MNPIQSVLQAVRSRIGAVVIIAGLTIVAMAPFGCSHTMAPGGVYAQDPVLYEADNTITTGHDLLQQFVDWEAHHRSVLSAYPEVRKFADEIMDQGPTWFAQAIALRDAYKINPTAENKRELQLSIDLLRQVVRTASSHLTTKKVTDNRTTLQLADPEKK